MATDLSTANVTDTKSGTGWTIDVTAANLLSDLSIKDFVMLIAGTLEPNSNITKTSQTVLTYNGASISSSTVEVRRVTPENRFQETTFAEKFSSTIYNEEIDRLIRKSYEYTLNGIGPGSTATIQTPLDDAYGVGWDADTVRPATRNALYDKFELQGDLADDEAITGNWTAPTQADANNSTRLATTAYADTRVTNALANSPALGGNPTTTTQAVDNNSTRIATTAFVQTQLENVPTATQGDVDESAANTEFVTELVNPVALVNTRATVTTSSTNVIIVYTVEDIDANNVYNSSNGRFTVPTNGAGIYHVGAGIAITNNDASARPFGIAVYRNGSVLHRVGQDSTITAAGAEWIGGSTLVNLADADYIEFGIINFNNVSMTYGDAIGDETSWAFFQRIGASTVI